MMGTDAPRGTAAADPATATPTETPTETPADLIEVLASVLGVQGAALGEDDGWHSVPGWTSRRQIEVVVALERHYGIPFTGPAVFGARTVGALRAALTAAGAAR